MNIHEDIIRNRRQVRFGIALGYVIAVALTAIRLVNTDPATLGETLGSLALGATLATPATLALLSLDRRPTLVPAAAVGALVSGIVTLWLLPIWLAVAWLWYRAWSGRPVRATISQARSAAVIGLGALTAVSMLALFAHVDPACTQRLADGTERSIDPATRGFDTGWAFTALGTTSGSSSSSLSSTGAAGTEVVEETCTSNTVVVGEALVSLGVTALILETGRRWPQGINAGAPRNRNDLEGAIADTP